MLKVRLLFLALISMMLFSCQSKKQNSNPITGIWKEYRADADDNYGLSTWKFNNDGSGIFMVQGLTNTQKLSFMWEEVNSSTIKIKMNDEELYLELSNGLLIENSSLGSIVYKKQ